MKTAYRYVNYKEVFFYYFFKVSASQSESEEPSGHKLSVIPSFPPTPERHGALFQSMLPLTCYAPVLC
jgi:hypothetical protein